MSSDRAIGLIETRGIVALTAGIEAMMKSADVRCIGIERVAAGFLAVTVQGSLAAVRQALEAGKAAVQKHGEVRCAEIFPKADDAAIAVLDRSLEARLSGQPGKK